MFLVHWREAEARVLAREIQHMGWIVTFESDDGERVGKRIQEEKPDVVVIYLTRLPSHGRETGHALETIMSTMNIPLVYVDGNEEAVVRTRTTMPDAVYTTTEKLEKVLADFCSH